MPKLLTILPPEHDPPRFDWAGTFVGHKSELLELADALTQDLVRHHVEFQWGQSDAEDEAGELHMFVSYNLVDGVTPPEVDRLVTVAIKFLDGQYGMEIKPRKYREARDESQSN